MPSTDIDGSPILIITVEEAKVAKTAIGAIQALDQAKWEEVYKKLTKFLDEVDSGM